MTRHEKHIPKNPEDIFQDTHIILQSQGNG